MNAPARGIHSSGRLAAFLAALILWQLFARVLQGTYRPVDILRQLVDKPALVGRALTATLQSAALGNLWGNPAAIAPRFPFSEKPIRILSLIVFCLPLIATGRIRRVLYGPGIGPQETLSALSVFYTTLFPL